MKLAEHDLLYAVRSTCATCSLGSEVVIDGNPTNYHGSPNTRDEFQVRYCSSHHATLPKGPLSKCAEVGRETAVKKGAD